MMQFIRLIGVLVCGMVIIPPVSAEDITWYLTDFPPYVILSESEKELGVDNRIIQTVIKNLPEYSYSFEVANYTRILNKFKAGEPGIVTPLFRTREREKYVLYTKISSYIVLPNGFIIRKKDKDRYLPFINDNGSIDIEAVCRSKKIKIGVSLGRSYSGIIDNMIRLHKKDGIFFERSGIDHLGVLKMVARNRIDAAFGFPVEIKYGGLGDQLEFLRISKMTLYIPVFFGVAKNEWGLHKINQLNSILEKQGILETFAQYYKDWLGEDIKPYYEKLRHSYYDKIKQ